MAKESKTSKQKSTSFSGLSTDDKLDRLYNTICADSDYVRKRFDELSATLVLVTRRVSET